MCKKTPAPEFLFNIDTEHQPCSFIKKRLQHRCFTVRLTKFLKVYFLQNSSDECPWFQFNLLNILRVHWSLLTILKTNKKLYEVMFFLICRSIYILIFWKFIQCATEWDKTQILKKFDLDKRSGTKNALFFLSRAPTHYSFTFNLRFIYELKHKVRLFKTMCGIFHFRFRFVILFLFSKKYGLSDLKTL